MIYNYVVTGSSVGYGDLAPQSAAGRLFAAFWVIPGALAGFAWMIGKVIQIIATSARNKVSFPHQSLRLEGACRERRGS